MEGRALSMEALFSVSLSFRVSPSQHHNGHELQMGGVWPIPHCHPFAWHIEVYRTGRSLTWGKRRNSHASSLREYFLISTPHTAAAPGEWVGPLSPCFTDEKP